MRVRRWQAAERVLLSVGAVQLAAIVLGPHVASTARSAWLSLVPLLSPLCRSGAEGSFEVAFTHVVSLAGPLAAVAFHGLHAMALLVAGSGAAAAVLAKVSDRRQDRAAERGAGHGLRGERLPQRPAPTR